MLLAVRSGFALAAAAPALARRLGERAGGALTLFVLLRGHNEPGGGFVGGSVVACGFGVYAPAPGVDAGPRARGGDPRALIDAGLARSWSRGCSRSPADGRS